MVSKQPRWRADLLAVASVLITAIEVLTIPSPVAAQWPPRPVCDSIAAQQNLNQCAARSAQWSEDRLQALLTELQARMSGPRFDSLHTIQQRWQEVRDDQCSWERAGYDGGSMGPMAQGFCLASATEERIAYLKVFLCEAETDCEASKRYDLNP
jgi:uncharacterized protein YecT (DUF1311 family)